jgi:multiple sugar transport system permease protein
MFTNSVRPYRKLRQGIYNIAAFTILTIGALPAVWIIFTAFRPANEVNVSPPVWIPKNVTLEAFENLFGLNPDYAAGIPVRDYMTNSIQVALISTIFSIALGTMAGYAFSRFEFRGHTLLFLFILLTRSVPGIALGLPLFLLMNDLGLVDKVSGLAFVYVAVNTPFTVWLMDGFFRQIPKELDDAAYIDGCGYWTFLWHYRVWRLLVSSPSLRHGTNTKSPV